MELGLGKNNGRSGFAPDKVSVAKFKTISYIEDFNEKDGCSIIG